LTAKKIKIYQPAQITSAYYSYTYVRHLDTVNMVNGPENSNLSSQKYGYDFTVSTTQGSINAGLMEYLQKIGQDQGAIKMIFIASDDPDSDVSDPIDLAQFLTTFPTCKDPFNISTRNLKEDDYGNNKDIETLTNDAGFMIGIEMKLGISKTADPSTLPLVVDFKYGIKNVGFNIVCSDVTVIVNNWPEPKRGKKPATQGSWIVTKQGKDPWYLSNWVDLDEQDLHNTLDNSTYLKNHPEEKKQIQSQLDNISGTMFTLKQLAYVLNSNYLQNCTASIGGIDPTSKAGSVLIEQLVKKWVDFANKNGLPLVSLSAEAQVPDPSQLKVTAFARQISKYKNDQGTEITNPNANEIKATTLDYLCATHGEKVPGPAVFNWNWVLETELKDKSGIISINRDVIAQFFSDSLVPQCKACCVEVKPWTKAIFLGGDYGWEINKNQTPKVTKGSGSTVLSISYDSSHDDESKGTLVYLYLWVHATYNCDVTFNKNTVTVKQRCFARTKFQFDSDAEEFNPVDITITDSYNVSVDQSGKIQMTYNKDRKRQDDSQSYPGGDFWTGFASNMDSKCVKLKKDLTDYVEANLKLMEFNAAKSFIFPGGKAFTFKAPTFSNNQDLTASLTYLKQTQTLKSEWTVRKARKQCRSLFHTIADVPAYALTSSTELMQNYIRGEIISHEGKLEAVQTDDGLSMIFGVDSKGVLRIFKETSTEATTGWDTYDISTKAIASAFPGGSVKTFDVGQSDLDGHIGIIMAIEVDGADHLFISSYNSPKNTSWVEKLRANTDSAWALIDYDADIGARKINIKGAMLAEFPGGKQHMVLDISRPEDAMHIERYWVVPENKGKGIACWVKHDVAIDIESDDYQSCVGRSTDQGPWKVDGLYIKGKVSDSTQLIYTDLYNTWDPEGAPPMVQKLSLPNGAYPTAIAAARHISRLDWSGDDDDDDDDLYGSTDLYAISGSKLHLLDGNDQANNRTGVMLKDGDIFDGTTTLLATMHNAAITTEEDGDPDPIFVTTLWGKNKNNEVFYLHCLASKLREPDSWSTPVPILTGIEHISSYRNRVDGGNTIVAAGGGKLIKLTQAVDASGSGLWRQQEIVLKTKPDVSALPLTSYTTTLRVHDDKGLPIKDATVQISANSRTPVYMNGLYYILDNTGPVVVKTDAAGILSVIEAIADLSGTVLTVSVDGGKAHTTINPMQQVFQKFTALKSVDELSKAVVYRDANDGGKSGSPTPLISDDITAKEKQTVVTALADIEVAYSQSQSQPRNLFRGGVVPSGLFRKLPGKITHVEGVFDHEAISVGDLYSWLKSKIKSGLSVIVNIIKDGASGLWKFVATIAGKTYHAFLNTIDAVVGAVVWVFNEIKTAVKDVIRFVEFLFEWDDIKRTKQVMHNIAKRFLEYQVDQIPTLQGKLDQAFDTIAKKTNEWGKADWSKLGDVATMPASGSASDPTQGSTSGSSLLANHFRDNAKDMVIPALPAADDVKSLVDVLIKALANEGKTLQATYLDLQDLATQFSSLSITDVIKRLVGIIATGVLSSVKVVADALLGILHQLLKSATTILDTEIYIPVISDILKKIGVPTFSILDLFTWIAAVGYTVVYKIVKDEAPFPQNEHVQAIIDAPSWEALLVQFGQPRPSAESALAAAAAGAPVPEIDDSTKSAAAVATQAVPAFLALTAAFVQGAEAEAPEGENPFAVASAIMGVAGSGIKASGGFLVPTKPIKEEAVRIVSDITDAVVITAAIIFSGPAQKALGANKGAFKVLATADGRGTGAIVNAILVVPALFVSGWHFYELSSEVASRDRTVAILGEVTNLAGYVARVSYAVAVNDPDPSSKQVPVAVLVGSNLAIAGLLTATATVVAGKTDKAALEADLVKVNGTKVNGTIKELEEDVNGPDSTSPTPAL
jgi:hypothetical protein